MNLLILNVRDTNDLIELEKICNVIFVSKLMNVVHIEIEDSKIAELENIDNVLEFYENRIGEYQPAV